MGKYSNGIGGPFRGRIGKVVGSRSKGVDYMRSLPTITTRPPTEKQLNQRKIFAMISAWLKPLKAIINIGFQIFGEGRSPMNRAHGLISKEALIIRDGDTKIDFKNVILSRGELFISFITEFLSLLDAILQINWKNLPNKFLSNDNDRATFVIYNPTKDKFVTYVDEANRSDENALLRLPSSFSGDMVHCWMQYVSQEGDRVSSSVYAGEILVE